MLRSDGILVTIRDGFLTSAVQLRSISLHVRVTPVLAIIVGITSECLEAQLRVINFYAALLRQIRRAEIIYCARYKPGIFHARLIITPYKNTSAEFHGVVSVIE